MNMDVNQTQQEFHVAVEQHRNALQAEILNAENRLLNSAIALKMATDPLLKFVQIDVKRFEAAIEAQAKKLKQLRIQLEALPGVIHSHITEATN